MFNQPLVYPTRFRCGQTDHLVVGVKSTTNILLYQTGLFLDLKSDSEREEGKSQLWMSHKPPVVRFKWCNNGYKNDDDDDTRICLLEVVGSTIVVSQPGPNFRACSFF
jgi:hypothetical protein